MVEREYTTERLILTSAMNDAINRYVRDVLVPRGLIDEARYDIEDVPGCKHGLYEAQWAIIESVADKWVKTTCNDP